MKGRAFFGKNKQSIIVVQYEVVQYGQRIFGGQGREMIQGGAGEVGWEQYVKGIVCLRLWNVYQRKQKDTVKILNRGVLYAE